MREVVRGGEAPGRPWFWTMAVGHYQCGHEYGYSFASGIPHSLAFLTVGGAGAFRRRDRRFIDGPGMLTVLPKGPVRSEWRTAGSHWEFYWLGLLGEGPAHWAEQLGIPYPPLAAPVQPARLPTLRSAFETLLAGMRRKERARSGKLQLEVLTLYDDLLDATRSGRGGSEARINGRGLLSELQRYLQRPAPTPDRVDDFATRLGITPEHLSRVLREIAGCSPKEYFLRARIHQAEELLRTTRLPIAEVGSRVGYPDPYHFSRLFRKRTGTTPTAWRQWSSGIPE